MRCWQPGLETRGRTVPQGPAQHKVIHKTAVQRMIAPRPFLSNSLEEIT